MVEQFDIGYALLIGIDENAVPQLALPDVAKDIAALEKVLLHPERCAYPAQNVKTIMGRQATRQGIQDGLDWLGTKLSADGSDNSTAVVFYTGHGWQDTDSAIPTYYLIPYDMQKGHFRLRALRAADFAETVNELCPRRLLVILDCCHAAGMDVKDMDFRSDAYHEAAIPSDIFVASGKSVPNASSKGISSLAEGSGRAVLSSCQGTQKSYIRSDRTMSIFTYHLIEALTGYAQPQAGATEVLVSDVMGYVTRTVPQSALRQDNAEQTPDFHVIGNFPIALLLGGKGLSKGEAPPNVLEMNEGEATPSMHIDTGGGALVGGNLNIKDGDFVGRDKIVYGDEVRGNKIDGVHIGNISGGIHGSVIAGRDASGNSRAGRDLADVKMSGTTIFDQRGQKVNYQYNAGGNVNFAAVQNKIDVIDQLEKFQAEVAIAVEGNAIDEDTATDVKYMLTKAVQQAKKPQPDKKSIVGFLSEAKELIAGVTTGAAAIGGLVAAVAQAIELVQRFF